MSVSAFTGPLVSFLDSNNPETAPSCFIEGAALLDPRGYYTYVPGQNFGSLTAGWSTAANILALDIAPAAAAAAAIAAAQTVTSGTAMTLVASSGAGIVVGQSVVNPNTGLTATGLLAVGQASARVAFGQAGTVQLWDPTTMTARAVIVTCNSASGTGGNITIKGYDVFGYPMTETLDIAPASALTVTGKKAWKYIASATPAFTDATYTYEIGTTDLFGLPLASTYAGDVFVNFDAALLTALTTYVAGVTTVATATTGDVRGTIGVPSSSDGTKRLVVYQNILLPNLALANGPGGTTVTGQYGVQQF